MSIERQMRERQEEYQKCAAQKELISKEKSQVEEEAVQIFTLYEMTKEITKGFSVDEAWKIFQMSLMKYVAFKECLFFEDESQKKQALNGGGQDYFTFTFKGQSRVLGYLAVKGNFSDGEKEKIMIVGHQYSLALRRLRLYQEIEKLAITDSLTEVYTRRYILERFEEELTRSQARQMKMSFLMIDVDYFKKYNDDHGHLTGDQILREISSVIMTNIRQIDLLGRYGGEEFCVILPDTDRLGAQYASERIRKAVQESVIKAYDTTVQVTVSIGTATFPYDGQKTLELIDKSDWALYRAKSQGRNQVSAFGVYK